MHALLFYNKELWIWDLLPDESRGGKAISQERWFTWWTLGKIWQQQKSWLKRRVLRWPLLNNLLTVGTGGKTIHNSRPTWLQAVQPLQYSMLRLRRRKRGGQSETGTCQRRQNRRLGKRRKKRRGVAAAAVQDTNPCTMVMAVLAVLLCVAVAEVPGGVNLLSFLSSRKGSVAVSRLIFIERERPEPLFCFKL